MTNTDYEISGRKAANEMSKEWAYRDKQPWTETDEAVLLKDWIHRSPDGRNEVDVSRRLERTIESCRVRCEQIRKRLGIQEHTVVKKRDQPYVGLHDEPEDRWWE